MEGDVTDKDFIAEGGIEVTDQMLEDWAEPWERGEVSGTAAGFVRRRGRHASRRTPLNTYERPLSLDL